MPGDLDRRALAAASATAQAYGLAASESVVIYSGSNVLVHLRPDPVIARVMTGTVALHDDPQTWLSREVCVLRFLEPAGLAVAPSGLIEPGPHCRDGLWMTFTEWVPDVKPAPEARCGVGVADARAFGQALRRLHEQLRHFDGELGGLRELGDDIERLRRRLQPADARQRDTIASLRDRLNVLRTGVLESTLPTQALHGDVSLRNLLCSPNGCLWNDFEDTFRGPVHWDVASAVGSLRIHGADTHGVHTMLDAYGQLTERELAPFLVAQDVYDDIWRMYDQQRQPA